MRFLAAVLIGGLATGSLLPNMWLSERLTATPAAAWIPMLGIIPLAVGALALHRGSVAAAGAFLLGIMLWIALWLRPSPPWSPSDIWSLQTWALFLAGQVAPGVAVTAVLGGIGGAAARFVARARQPARGAGSH